MIDTRRHVAFRMLAIAGAWLLPSGIGHAQERDYQPPKLGRYKVESGSTGIWTRDLVIENDKDYTLYEARNGPFYGRGTYSFDGRYVRFLSGPFHAMGVWGSSYRLPDGKHSMRLGGFEATSMD